MSSTLFRDTHHAQLLALEHAVWMESPNPALWPHLNRAAEKAVEKATQKEKVTDVTVVVATHLNYGVTLDDMRRVNAISTSPNGKWLGDVAMNCYFAMIEARSNEDGRLPRVRALNSFTYDCLVKGKSIETWQKKATRSRGSAEDAQDGTIFDYDIVMATLFLTGNHWALMAADMNTKCIVFYDSLYEHPLEEVDKHVDRFRNFIIAEKNKWKNDEKRKDGKIKKWEDCTFDDLKRIPYRLHPKTPGQSDGVSCGIFVLAAADLLSRKQRLTGSFSQADIGFFRNSIVFELYAGKLQAHAVGTTEIAGQDTRPAVVGGVIVVGDSPPRQPPISRRVNAKPMTEPIVVGSESPPERSRGNPSPAIKPVGTIDIRTPSPPGVASAAQPRADTQTLSPEKTSASTADQLPSAYAVTAHQPQANPASLPPKPAADAGKKPSKLAVTAEKDSGQRVKRRTGKPPPSMAVLAAPASKFVFRRLPDAQASWIGIENLSDPGKMESYYNVLTRDRFKELQEATTGTKEEESLTMLVTVARNHRRLLLSLFAEIMKPGYHKLGTLNAVQPADPAERKRAIREMTLPLRLFVDLLQTGVKHVIQAQWKLYAAYLKSTSSKEMKQIRNIFREIVTDNQQYDTYLGALFRKVWALGDLQQPNDSGARLEKYVWQTDNVPESNNRLQLHYELVRETVRLFLLLELHEASEIQLPSYPSEGTLSDKEPKLAVSVPFLASAHQAIPADLNDMGQWNSAIEGDDVSEAAFGAECVILWPAVALFPADKIPDKSCRALVHIINTAPLDAPQTKAEETTMWNF